MHDVQIIFRANYILCIIVFMTLFKKNFTQCMRREMDTILVLIK